MRLKLRIDSVNPTHTRVTVFQDGGQAGRLCLTTQAFAELSAVFLLADRHSDDFNFEIEDAVFKQPTSAWTGTQEASSE